MIRLTVVPPRLRQASRKFVGALNREAPRAMRLSGEEFVSAMQDRFRGYDGNRGDLLQNRSKRLRGSFGYDVSGALGTGDGLRLVAFSQGVPYARLQNYGGTIRPKRRRHMTIPLREALTASGVDRYPSAGYLFETYPKQLFVAKTSKGNLLIGSRGKPGRPPVVRKKPRRRVGSKAPRRAGDVIWLYLLRESVTIPPRLGFEDAWRSLADRRQARILGAFATASREFRS